MATSVQTTQRKRRYTEDDLKHLPRDDYKLRELFAGGVITSPPHSRGLPSPRRRAESGGSAAPRAGSTAFLPLAAVVDQQVQAERRAVGGQLHGQRGLQRLHGRNEFRLACTVAPSAVIRTCDCAFGFSLCPCGRRRVSVSVGASVPTATGSSRRLGGSRCNAGGGAASSPFSTSVSPRRVFRSATRIRWLFVSAI
jgi:hypothetical protein